MSKPATETWIEFNNLISLVNEQADDDSIWFPARSTTEAHLQEKIRLLHKRVEIMHAAFESQYSAKQ